MEWNLSVFILSTFFVMLGSLLQAVTGLGSGLIIVPLLATISIELIPAPMIMASLSLSSLMAWRGKNDIDYSNMSILLPGLIIGTIFAALFIASLPINKLGALFGIMILISVFISMKTSQIYLVKKELFGAGTLSGFMGATAGIGAPVLALIYQHHTGKSLQPTLAFLYFFSSIIMLIALHFAGRFSTTEFISGLYLIPGFVLGYLFSPRLTNYLDKGYARTAVLLISSISAIFLIGRGF